MDGVSRAYRLARFPYTHSNGAAVFLRESHATRKITGKGICFLGMHYTSDTLSEQEMQSAVLRTADIEYLLSSFQSEEQDDIARQVGFQFAILRRKKGLSTQQVADQLAYPSRRGRNGPLSTPHLLSQRCK